MRTYQRSTALPEQTKPARAGSVKFRDGMIVTADDLEAAQRYPVSLLHTVLRSYLGCGVVCGLELRVKEVLDKRPVWVVCVERGVAIDCQGSPIELCASVELDLGPDACDDESPPDQVYVLIRRFTSEEAPRDACSCDTDGPQFDCRRVREHVMVKAISREDLETLPDCVCRRPKKDPEARNGKSLAEELCAALTGCPECTCGESWILLGSVRLRKDKGIEGPPDMSERRWVNPTEVLCSALGMLEERIAPQAAEQARKPVEPTPETA